MCSKFDTKTSLTMDKLKEFTVMDIYKRKVAFSKEYKNLGE
jgi:hypothetical protein